MLRNSVVRAASSASASASLRQASAVVAPINQARRAHAISNPTLANIEKRWEAMPPQEQADLWMALRDRMKVDWTELTIQEKKAGMSTTTSIRLQLLLEIPIRPPLLVRPCCVGSTTSTVYPKAPPFSRHQVSVSVANAVKLSLLDRLRPSRSPCSDTSRRGHQGLCLHYGRPRRQRHPLRHRTILRPRTTSNHDQRIPGGNRGVPQGTSSSKRTGESQNAADTTLQEQNVEPITGISAEDWKGNFSVQSRPAGK